MYLVGHPECHELIPVKGRVAPLVTPESCGINATAGDDTNPPNAVTTLLNAITTWASGNVGFSVSPERKNIHPSGVEYNIKMKRSTTNGKIGLDLGITLIFSNPVHRVREESMMIWAKMVKQYINDSMKSELELVSTNFQDRVNGEWVNIDSKIEFAETAEAVLQSVVTSGVNQSAGTVTGKGLYNDAKLGPVGREGKIILRYQVQELYTYAYMNTADTAATMDVVPLAIFIPHSGLVSHHGAMTFEVQFEGCEGSTNMSVGDDFAAYKHLRQHSMLKSESNVTILLPQLQGTGFQYAIRTLPPQPTALMLMLKVPSDSRDTVALDRIALAIDDATSTFTIFQPVPEDTDLLCGPTIGSGGSAMYLRGQLKLGGFQTRAESETRVYTSLLVSDASGSTAMSVPRDGSSLAPTVSVRTQFNEMAINRTLSRIAMIPSLLENKLAMERDIMGEYAYMFDGDVLSKFLTVFKLKDVARYVTAITEGAFLDHRLAETFSQRSTLKAAIPKSETAALDAFDSICKFCDSIRSMTSHGSTSFKSPANVISRDYDEYVNKIKKLDRDVKPVFTTYVDFDTDGGNNGGAYEAAWKEMVEKCNVVGGCVNGFGAWVNQNDATKVSQILKGPCQLFLSVPHKGSEGANACFRRGMSSWLRTIRYSPVTVSLEAGYVSWNSKITRHDNGMEVIAIGMPCEDSKVQFDEPDVTKSTKFTATTLKNLNAGDTVMVYLQSRHGNATDLARKMRVNVNGLQCPLQVIGESNHDIFLGHEWLRVLNSTASDRTASICRNKNVSKQYLQRIEVDISHNFNIPTLSGSTAFLGRAETVARDPIPKSKQPSEPERVKVYHGLFGAQPSRMIGAAPAAGGGTGGLFGSSAPASASLFGTASCVPASSFGAQERSDFLQERTALTPSEILKATDYLKVPSHTICSTTIAAEITKVLNTQLRHDVEICAGPLNTVKNAVNYHCDGNSCTGSSVRFHCLCCINYDLCSSCYTVSRSTSLPKGDHEASHHMAKYGKATPLETDKETKEDPLVASEFGSWTEASEAASVFSSPVVLGTVVDSTDPSFNPLASYTVALSFLRLIRFLLVLREWSVVLSDSTKKRLTPSDVLDPRYIGAVMHRDVLHQLTIPAPDTVAVARLLDNCIDGVINALASECGHGK